MEVEIVFIARFARDGLSGSRQILAQPSYVYPRRRLRKPLSYGCFDPLCRATIPTV